jgi:CRISPR-associated exonuclease Cas4
MYSDYLHLSLLSQYNFCKRRAALILLENAWHDNEYTIEGTLSHERVHSQGHVKRNDTINVYDYSVFSNKLRLSGKCDCIEATIDEKGFYFPLLERKCILYPIEFKRGIIRNEEEYNVQLCGQAMCLEEMYGGIVTKGSIFYINSHRRVEVVFTKELKCKVEDTAKRLWELLETKQIPQENYTAKCKKCSLYELCLPKVSCSAKAYNSRVRQTAIGGDGF